MSPSPAADPPIVRPDRTGRPDVDGLIQALSGALDSPLRHGGELDDSRPAPLDRLSTGFAGLDRLLEGGIPRGSVSEIAGPTGSGSTALGLSLLAAATRGGEVAAWIDPEDALDPGAAEAVGVRLEQVLWVRAPGMREALRASERLLETRGFGLVVIDRLPLSSPGPAPSSDRPDRRPVPRPPSVPRSAWQRLQRSAARSRTSLVLLGNERVHGASPDLALVLEPERACFGGPPRLLEGVELRATLARHRWGPTGGELGLRLDSG